MIQSYTCSRPFYDVLAGTVGNPSQIFDWIFCPYTITGLGLTGVGLFIVATGFVGLKNWSETWTLPLTWLALVTPVLVASMLPGALAARIFGAVVTGVAMTFIGLWFWFGRS